MESGIKYTWLVEMPRAFFLAFLVLAIVAYVVRNNERWVRFCRTFSFKHLLWATIGVRIAYAGLLTILQYFTWAQDKVGSIFLHESLGKSVPLSVIQDLPWIFGSRWGYFVFYSLLHFWLNVALSIFIAWLFYRFLILLKRHKERFFEEGEVELGFLTALIVGWPAFTLFVPAIFIFVVLASLVRLIIFKEAYTTLGWPFILAALASLAFGSFLLAQSGLLVLSV